MPNAASLMQKIQTIIAQKGAMDFAQFMQLALYDEKFGYYTTHEKILGAQGDFVTAPLISPLFSACIAQCCERVLSECRGGNILELGAGTGKMAGDILLTLNENNALPEHYFILEISPTLRSQQQHYLREKLGDLFSRVIWLEKLPTDFIGIMVANEVLDALPVHLFHYQNNTLFERCVTVKNDVLAWQDKPANDTLSRAVENLSLSPEIKQDYLSEINLALPSFINALSHALKKGIILFIDYGFEAPEYYHPDRRQGTLMCHTQHKAHADPLLSPGSQDMTAHVDFTAVATAAKDSGLTVIGLTTQAHFLCQHGLLEKAEHLHTHLSLQQQLALSHALQLLLMPHEMGELCKVMALGRNTTLSDQTLGLTPLF